MFEQGYENEDRYNTQQGRRPYGSSYDRRGSSRGFDDRFEQDRHRYRGQESDRRYTRPDYDSELDIERPGQPHFGSRGGTDYASEYEQEHSSQRPYRSSHFGDRYGHEGSHRFDSSRGGQADYGSYGRGMADWGRGSGDFRSGASEYGRGMSESGRGMGEYGRGMGEYGRGMGEYGRGMGEYGRGMGEYGRGMGEYGRGGRESGRDFRESGRDFSTGSGMGHADWNRHGFADSQQDWGRRSFDQSSHFNEQRNRWPKSYKRSDERIKDDIHEELIRHGRIDAVDIEVQVKDGEVTLGGHVSSRQDKRIAEELAEKVLGVQDVQNQLRVRSQQSQAGDEQKAGSGSSSGFNLPGSNRMPTTGQQGQDQNKTAVNQSK